MLTSRDRTEVQSPIGNPIAGRYRVPVDHSVSPDPREHRTELMPTPRLVNEGATDLLTGEATNGATVNSGEATEPYNGSGWRAHDGPRADLNTRPTPEPVWTGGDGGTHPALKR